MIDLDADDIFDEPPKVEDTQPEEVIIEEKQIIQEEPEPIDAGFFDETPEVEAPSLEEKPRSLEEVLLSDDDLDLSLLPELNRATSIANLRKVQAEEAEEN